MRLAHCETMSLQHIFAFSFALHVSIANLSGAVTVIRSPGLTRDLRPTSVAPWLLRLAIASVFRMGGERKVRLPSDEEQKSHVVHTRPMCVHGKRALSYTPDSVIVISLVHPLSFAVLEDDQLYLLLPADFQGSRVGLFQFGCRVLRGMPRESRN